MSLLSMLKSIAVVLVSSPLAGAADAPRVFDASQAPDDRRLQVVNDVDHPVQFHPHFKDRSEWEQRASRLREQVLVAEGLWPLPPRTPLNAVIHGKIDRDDYTIEKVFFASYPGHYVSGNLYRPKNRTGKLPAVLCPHGHWPNGRFFERTDDEGKQQIEEGAEKTMHGAKYPIQARCAMLARMGCIVFQYDMVGYADSNPIEHREGFTDAEAILRLQSFMGLQTWNSIRALDFVEALPDVDKDRIAVTGASGGGTQTFMLCAADDRPAVAFPAVMVSEEMQGGCICENAPLLRVGTNNVELACTFAPKPMGMSAANDWTHALENVGLPEMQTIWGLFGAKDRVMARHFSFEHNYNQVSRELMYNWMNKHLKLGWESPVAEKPFEPVPPKELSVYDDEHPRPADACDAKSLRKYMTETSDRQLGDLWKNDPTEYRRVVATALRVMVDDQLPPDGDVVVSRASGPQARDGIIVETGALGRRDAGEAVPFVSLVPQEWNGTIVVWAHPDGKSSLFDAEGQPSADVRRLLDGKSAVISADLFLTGELESSRPPGNPEYEKQTYAGFLCGYNRSLLANRVHDLLTVISYARHWKQTKALDLLAFDKAGPPALLARALAADAVRRAAINLGGFDFDQVTDPIDPMMLPGALKYGGIDGFVPLLQTGRTLILHPADPNARTRASTVNSVTLEPAGSNPHAAIEWLIGARE